MSSKDISFSKVIPWLLDQDNLTEDFSVNLVFPIKDQVVFESGMLIFLSDVTNPLSIRYPFSTLRGPKRITYSLFSKEVL